MGVRLLTAVSLWALLAGCGSTASSGDLSSGDSGEQSVTDSTTDARVDSTPAPDTATPVDAGLDSRSTTSDADAAGDARPDVTVDAVTDTGPCVPESQTSACTDRHCGSVPDGCGGSYVCGTCTAPETCTSGFCLCPTTGPIAAYCASVGFDCGTFTDACGTHDCGPCGGVFTCGGGGVPNHCGCTPRAAADVCATTCGSVSDGCKMIDCPCTSPQTCGGGGVTGKCGCTPKTCSGDPTMPRGCGMNTDGCGGSIDCGACPSVTAGCGGPGDGMFCVDYCSPYPAFRGACSTAAETYGCSPPAGFPATTSPRCTDSRIVDPTTGKQIWCCP